MMPIHSFYLRQGRGAVVFFCVSMLVVTNVSAAGKPNILLFMPDQHRYDYTSLNTESAVFSKLTPNLLKLANAGISFNLAFCPSPQCAPSRSCNALGKEYNNQPVLNNGHNLPLDSATFYKLLRDVAGYNVYEAGKSDLAKPAKDWGANGMHPSTDRVARWGFTRMVDCAGKLDAVSACNSSTPEPYFSYLKSIGYKSCDLPLIDSVYEDNWIAARGLELLSAAPKNSPWFLQVNLAGPHNPYDPTPSMYNDWKNAVFPPAVNASGDNTIRQKYAAAIFNIDRLLGRYLDSIKARGELGNTIIVFTADHGDMMGDHGYYHKQRPLSPSACVPFVWYGPGIKTGVRVHTATETLDMVATFLDYAGVPVPLNMDSRSLRPFLETLKGYPRRYAVSAWEDWSLVYDGRYKLIKSRSNLVDAVGSGDAQKSQVLYDLLKDPGETRDIAPANSAIVSRLQLYLQAPGHSTPYVSKDTVPPDSVAYVVSATSVVRHKTRHDLLVSLGPNPFRKTIRISLPAFASQGTEIIISDLRGAIVRHWRLQDTYAEGAAVVWDGRDAKGTAVVPGMYAVHIRCGPTAVSRTINKTEM